MEINKAEHKPLDLHPPEKKIVKVTTGTVLKKKKSWVDKLSETFWGDDAATVADYVIYDVLIPAAKNTLYDMVKSGFERLLFGEVSTRRGLGRSDRDKIPYVSYGGYFSGGKSERIEPRTRSGRHSLADVLMDNKRAAEDVLTILIEAIREYGVVTVADYYEAAGVPSEFTDNNYGWSNLSDASVKRVLEGYILDLPMPRALRG